MNEFNHCKISFSPKRLKTMHAETFDFCKFLIYEFNGKRE